MMHHDRPPATIHVRMLVVEKIWTDIEK